ncbi:MAG: DinB family protein [Anaerolineae bacterium]
MDAAMKTLLWKQFGAAIDMFSDAVNACPDHLWTAVLWKDDDDPRYGQFWFVAYHTLFWLDMYLTGVYEGFTPPAPFVRGKLPETPYTKAQVLTYLAHCRQRCQSVMEGLTDEQANRICTFEWMAPSFLELQLYSMRHVQEHAAQLNLVLGQNGVTGMDWVPPARDSAT